MLAETGDGSKRIGHRFLHPCRRHGYAWLIDSNLAVDPLRMKPVLFISDLHLDPARPAITELFLQFLRQRAVHAQQLFILGDLFEAWIGDDAVPAEHPVLAGLRQLTNHGVAVHVMHGNRDFLLGKAFASATGCHLLQDLTTVELGGEPVLLMHGDLLCTDDEEYQKFRAMVHNPQWQAGFLAMPVEQRLTMARQARSESTSRNSKLSETAEQIMDVNQHAVEQTMAEQHVRRLIHGHTHRPNVHHFKIHQHPATRIVLGDWYDQGSVLEFSNGHYDLQTLPV